MPKAKHRDRDRRGERFPRGKRRLDPWQPLPPLGAVLETVQPLTAYWGAIGPRTLVRVAGHTAEAPGNYGPGLLVLPVDPNHPLHRAHAKVGPGATDDELPLYVENRQIKTHLKPT